MMYRPTSVGQAMQYVVLVSLALFVGGCDGGLSITLLPGTDGGVTCVVQQEIELQCHFEEVIVGQDCFDEEVLVEVCDFFGFFCTFEIVIQTVCVDVFAEIEVCDEVIVGTIEICG